MMGLTLVELVRSVYGAVRLAMLDGRGLDCFDRSPEGAIRSFWAAAVVLPAYVLLVLVRDGESFDGLPFGYILLVQGLAYTVGWAAFPVIMSAVSRLIGREAEYPGMVAAYNWSAVVQVALQLPLIAAAGLGILEDGDIANLAVIILGLIVAYLWFVLRTSLRVGWATAAGLVILELFTTALISDYANRLLDLGRLPID